RRHLQYGEVLAVSRAALQRLCRARPVIQAAIDGFVVFGGDQRVDAAVDAIELGQEAVLPSGSDHLREVLVVPATGVAGAGGDRPVDTGPTRGDWKIPDRDCHRTEDPRNDRRGLYRVDPRFRFTREMAAN